MSTARSIAILVGVWTVAAAAAAFVLGYKPGGYPRQHTSVHVAAPPFVQKL
ncbi:MAG: hypothetical protein WA869_29145 [Alloacidobacterium sp.]